MDPSTSATYSTKHSAWEVFRLIRGEMGESSSEQMKSIGKSVWEGMGRAEL